VAVLTLAAVAVLTGVVNLLAIRRFSNQNAIRRAKRRIWAHLYELRLFGDDPAATIRAQRKLISWNARYAALMLRPAAVLFAPMLVLVVALDCVYGRRPLRPGEAAIVTARIRGAPDAALAASNGFTVETPPVRIPDRSEICWRVRANAPAKGELRVTAGEAAAGQAIDARPGFRFLRTGWLSVATWRGKPVRSVEVEYPAASLSLFGFEFWWPVPFAAIGLAAMLALRNRFRATF
jgi:hypothetical protein